METEKFHNKYITAGGKDRASVPFNSLKTLWFNTGTLCNLTCKNCYIESSPQNDRLSFLTSSDVDFFLIEIRENKLPTQHIGLTGGEPFLNPHIIAIIKKILSHGHNLLILTNANKVIKKHQDDLLKINQLYKNKMRLRISLDHFTPEVHDRERGKNAFSQTMSQMQWLSKHHFNISIAGRSLHRESLAISIRGHQKLLHQYKISLNLDEKLIIFPEMRTPQEVPEITTECWDILDKTPAQQMCASERMVVKKKGDQTPTVMPCTLLAYDEQFNLGNTLFEAKQKVYLNHRFCAEFCVLGGATCS